MIALGLSSPLQFVILFLLILLALALIKRRCGRSAGGIIGGGLALVAVAVMISTTRPVRPTHQVSERAPAPTIQYMPQTKHGPLTARNRNADVIAYPQTEHDWTASEDHAFMADLYPSERSAALALSTFVAKKMRGATSKELPDGAKYQLRVVGNVPRSLLIEVGERVRETLEPTYPMAMNFEIEGVTCEVKDATLAPNQMRVHVRVSDRPDPKVEAHSTGHMQVTIASGRGDAFLRTTRFADEPWSTDFQRWVAQYPRTIWLLGRSSPYCATAAEAREMAVEHAAGKLADHLRSFIDGQRDRYTMPRAFEDSNWLRNQLRAAIEQNQIPTRSFQQEFQRPYGKVYRHAVLVKVERTDLAQLAGRYAEHVVSRQRSWLQSALATLGLVAAITVVYVFLDTATKGYYVWSIRAAMLAVAAGGLYVLWQLR